MFAIELENVSKAFEGLPVLRGLNLQIAQGEVYGLLGPNGSGKSTLIHLLLGLLRPQQGRVRVFGMSDPNRAHARIGYLPERLRYHLRFTGREYLRFLGQFNDLREPELSQRVNTELEAVGLSDAANRRLGTYSRGMLQRIGIAQALLHTPDLLLLDEPTGGLDPAGQREMLQLLTSLRERGSAVLLTTHYLDEIDQVCDRVGILFGGRIAAEVSVASLRVTSHNVMIELDTLTDDLRLQLAQFGSAVTCHERSILLSPNDAMLQARVIRRLLDANVTILSLTPQAQPLADLYARVVRGEMPEPTEPPPTNTPSDNGTPPNHLFAPPGHRNAAQPGDTLLHDLLEHKGE